MLDVGMALAVSEWEVFFSEASGKLKQSLIVLQQQRQAEVPPERKVLGFVAESNLQLVLETEGLSWAGWVICH